MNVKKVARNVLFEKVVASKSKINGLSFGCMHLLEKKRNLKSRINQFPKRVLQILHDLIWRILCNDFHDHISQNFPVMKCVKKFKVQES